MRLKHENASEAAHPVNVGESLHGCFAAWRAIGPLKDALFGKKSR
jgi:hypothetical protein